MNAMTDRERYLATMHYQPRDRVPICDMGLWPATYEAWHRQGMPAWVCDGYVKNVFFGMEPLSGGPRGKVDLVPPFESRVLEDQGDFEVFQQADGARIRRHKTLVSIPGHESHLLTDRASWEKHYKWRLDPATPGRLPRGDEWEAAVALWRDTNRPDLVTLFGGSLYGWIRNWMGMENVSYLVYDDPALFEEMVTTITDCVVATLSRVLETGGTFDACGIWEDMCYNAGPLLGVEHFRKYLVPNYQRITGLLRRHGVDIVYLDSDGRIDQLIPYWLEAGVNCLWPIEIGTTGNDPIAFRKQFGRELRMMGGFDKRILAGPRSGIEREVRRLAPLVEDGGYIPFADHLVPPDVPFDNYVYYVELARTIWAGGVSLKPAPAVGPGRGTGHAGKGSAGEVPALL